MLDNETALRFTCFAVMLLLMTTGEKLLPRRPTPVRPVRWFSNLALAALNVLAVRVCFPLGAVAVAALAEQRSWGLFNNVRLHDWLAVLLSLFALDLAIYLQHILFHAVPLLWRLHRVHHSDRAFDVSTGLRFHVVEILLSMGIKLAAIILLGAAPVTVVIFEIILNVCSMFNHSNIYLPTWLDRAIRLFLVTPDMHRVHHSVVADETNSNFGFNLPWWDYLFGTYRSQPRAGHEGMTIGLTQFRTARVDQLHWMLAMPFLASVGDYSGKDEGELTASTQRKNSTAIS